MKSIKFVREAEVEFGGSRRKFAKGATKCLPDGIADLAVSVGDAEYVENKPKKKKAKPSKTKKT